MRLLCALALLAGAQAAWAQAAAEGFYRFPALHGQTVYFVAEGDIWRVPLAGGRAERMTTHPGVESRPAVSPDGRQIAFTAAYEGPIEVYAMPAQGGLPRRLTWGASGPLVWGWTPAGEVLITAPTESGRPGVQLYAIEPGSLAQRALPAAQASDGALLQDGRTLLFTRSGLPANGDNVRAYRGGALARLWQMDLASASEATPLIVALPGMQAMQANARRPMPYAVAGGQRVAFLCDEGGSFNVWSVDAQGRDLRQHTRHTAWDVRHAAIDGTRVVYAIGADLRLVDLASGTDRKLDITLGGDFDQQRTRWVAAPPYFNGAALAPGGDSVLVGARGRLATLGLGSVRRAELPVPADAACQGGRFSHDSRHVFALCDTSGEIEIWRFAANGVGAPLRITTGGTVTRKTLFPSPDGRWIAHTDHAGRLTLTAIDASGAAAAPDKIIASGASAPSRRDVWWSPDGKALVFDELDATSSRTRLVLYTVADGQALRLTSDRYVSDAPAFTPDGRWMYFLSDRRFEAVGASPWGDRNMGPLFDRRTSIYALALQAGARFPFQPRDELSPPATSAAAAAPAASAASVASAASAAAQRPAAAASAGASAPIRVAALQTAGLVRRLHQVPAPAGNYSRLATDGKRLYFLDTERAVGSRPSLRSLAIDDNGAAPELLSADVQAYELTPDGKRMLIVRAVPRTAAATAVPGLPPRAGEILLIDADPKLPAEPARFQLRWADWQLAVEPRSEWRQVFGDAWRMHRDYLFDSGMNGIDWLAQRRQHEALLPRVADRAELIELMSQMVTSLGVLHSQVRAPDVRRGSDQVFPAALGGRLATVADGFRVERIFRGDPELPDEASPLQQARVLEGETIVAVNGRSARDVPALAELLRGQEGRQVLLTVKNAKGIERSAVTTPVGQQRDQALRTTDWEWGLAEQTLQRSGGRIGYLRMRAMTAADLNAFVREFFSHIGRDGLVIDVRANGGGSIDSWVIDRLLRRAWMFWQPRAPEGARPFSNMQQSFRGHVAVLIDDDTYSDGETFAEGIRRLGIGTLIGTRTAGAGIWLSDANRTIDNGIMRVAESAQFAADGSAWLIERTGVAPDIEVDLPPRATFSGGDAQLDAAIAHLQARIAAQPVTVPRPPSPMRPFAQPFSNPPAVPAASPSPLLQR